MPRNTSNSMIFVLSFQIIILVIAFFECESAALLRTPKVYNALITTDQNLTPSRAYPVLQSAIHDPFFYGPYGYNPYPSYYDPFGFNPFESAAYIPKYNADGTINVNSAAAATAAGTATVGVTDDSVSRSVSGNKEGGAVAQAGSTEKSPIPLNEFGFPPSLIPISSGKTPVNLAPFSYNSYPILYDQFGGYGQAAYLPHFGVLPQTPYTAFGGITQTKVDERASGVDAGSDAAIAGIGGIGGPGVNGFGTPGVNGFGALPPLGTPGLDGSDVGAGAPGVAGTVKSNFIELL